MHEFFGAHRDLSQIPSAFVSRFVHHGQDGANASTTRVVAPRLSGKRCVFCETTLDVHQAVRGGICDTAVCRQKRIVELVARHVREKVAVRRLAAAFHARIAPALGMADPQSLALAIVPDFRRPVIRIARARRKQLRAHLTLVVRQAFEESLKTGPASELTEEPGHAAQPSPGFPHDRGACATCRGHCCREGGTHAYLDTTAIRSYIARHPGLRWRQVVQAYLKNVPTASFADSCIFHGRRGCALPREMRSSICNEYCCEGLKELRETLAESGPKPVLVVATSGKKIGRAVLLKCDGSPARHRAESAAGSVSPQPDQEPVWSKNWIRP